MKTMVDIIYKAPKQDEPAKPGFFSLVDVSTIIYLLYLILDKNLRLTVTDLFLIPLFALAIGLQLFLYLRKKK